MIIEHDRSLSLIFIISGTDGQEHLLSSYLLRMCVYQMKKKGKKLYGAWLCGQYVLS